MASFQCSFSQPWPMNQTGHRSNKKQRETEHTHSSQPSPTSAALELQATRLIHFLNDNALPNEFTISVCTHHGWMNGEEHLLDDLHKSEAFL
jgi:hypothetical protein